jgi:hypothetical protein
VAHVVLERVVLRAGLSYYVVSPFAHLQAQAASRSPVLVTMAAYERLLADAVTDYRYIVRWNAGNGGVSPSNSAGSGTTPAVSLPSVPTWRNCSTGWLLTSIPLLPLSPNVSMKGCPGDPPIARQCASAAAFALDGDPGTVLLAPATAVSQSSPPQPLNASRGLSDILSHAVGGSAASASSSVLLVLDLGTCASLSGLRATIQVSPPPSTGSPPASRPSSATPATSATAAAAFALATSPVSVSLYALSDPSARGWREVSTPLRVQFIAARTAQAAVGVVETTFPAFGARYWAVSVVPVMPLAGGASVNRSFAGFSIRVPDLTVQLSARADPSAPCPADALVTVNDDDVPSVPKARSAPPISMSPPSLPDCMLLRKSTSLSTSSFLRQVRLLLRLASSASSADIKRVMNGLRSVVGSSLLQASVVQ